MFRACSPVTMLPTPYKKTPFQKGLYPLIISCWVKSRKGSGKAPLVYWLIQPSRRFNLRRRAGLIYQLICQLICQLSQKQVWEAAPCVGLRGGLAVKNVAGAVKNVASAVKNVASYKKLTDYYEISPARRAGLYVILFCSAF